MRAQVLVMAGRKEMLWLFAHALWYLYELWYIFRSEARFGGASVRQGVRKCRSGGDYR